MKLTTGFAKVLALVVVLSATACVGVYDTGVASTPHYGNGHVDGTTYVSTYPATPTYYDYCGIVSGTSLPGTTVAIYDDATCTGAPLATTTTDSTGYFEVSVCASGPTVNARSFDSYGQGSVCGGDMWVEDANASTW